MVSVEKNKKKRQVNDIIEALKDTKAMMQANPRRSYKLRVVVELPLDRSTFRDDDLADVSAAIAAITTTQDLVYFAEMLRILAVKKKRDYARPRLVEADLSTKDSLWIDVPRVIDKARRKRRSLYRPTPVDRVLYQQRHGKVSE